MKKEYVRLTEALKILVQHDAIRRAPLREDFYKVQLAELRDEIPSGEQWVFEEKYDGYRILAVNPDPKLRLLSRNSLDWTERFQEIAQALNRLSADSYVLDGEVVVQDASGHSSFAKLQNALTHHETGAFKYYVFDILYLNGFDLRPLPLLARKELLRHLLKVFEKVSPLKKIFYSNYQRSGGEKLYRQAQARHGEGIIAKDATATYKSGQRRDWFKVKCLQQEEFVIGGFTDPMASRAGFGALLLGFYDESGNFIYSGRVGTGFAERDLYAMGKTLKKIEITHSPFQKQLNALEKKGVHYVRPRLVAQISFTERTPDGRLRHPVFLGLREDKKAKEVRNSKRSH